MKKNTFKNFQKINHELQTAINKIDNTFLNAEALLNDLEKEGYISSFVCKDHYNEIYYFNPYLNKEQIKYVFQILNQTHTDINKYRYLKEN